MAFISIFFIFIISDHGSIFCGVAGWKNSDGYIQCQARDWICGEWFKHNHTKKRNKPINANTHGFPTGQLWHIYFFRLKWPTLEKHPLVPALEVVVEPKLNTELANKNFRSIPSSHQKPEQELNSTNSKSHVNQAECAKSTTRHRHRVSNWHQEEHWCSLDWHWGAGGRVAAFLCGLAVLECNLFCVTS